VLTTMIISIAMDSRHKTFLYQDLISLAHRIKNCGYSTSVAFLSSLAAKEKTQLCGRHYPHIPMVSWDAYDNSSFAELEDHFDCELNFPRRGGCLGQQT
jgi:hypothetical protein